jgi:hypothetical protein
MLIALAAQTSLYTIFVAEGCKVGDIRQEAGSLVGALCSRGRCGRLFQHGQFHSIVGRQTVYSLAKLLHLFGHLVKLEIGNTWSPPCIFHEKREVNMAVREDGFHDPVTPRDRSYGQL